MSRKAFDLDYRYSSYGDISSHPEILSERLSRSKHISYLSFFFEISSWNGMKNWVFSHCSSSLCDCQNSKLSRRVEESLKLFLSFSKTRNGFFKVLETGDPFLKLFSSVFEPAKRQLMIPTWKQKRTHTAIWRLIIVTQQREGCHWND